MLVSKAASGELKRASRSLMLGVMLSIISSLSSVILMGAAGYFLTMMGIAGFLGVSCNIFILSALIRLCALLRTLLRYLERIINHNLTFKVIERWRHALYQKVLALSYDEAMLLQSHNVERTLRHDIAVIESLYIKEALPIVCALILGLILGTVLSAFSIKLALAALSLMVFSSAVLPLVILKLKGIVKVREALLAARLQRQSGNLIMGLFDLKSAGAVEFIQEKTVRTIRRKAQCRARFTFYEGLAEAVLTSCASLILPLAILILLPLLKSGVIAGPTLICLSIAAMASYEWLMPVPLAILAFKESLLSLRRIALLEKKGEEGLKQRERAKETMQNVDAGSSDSAAAGGRALAIPPKVSELNFDKVSFKRGAHQILKDFSYTFKSSENYLIEGRVGAGKTTLMMLFSGILMPQSGSIKADGVSIGTFNQEEWRSHYALSLQEIAILPGTIREILREVKRDASDEECWAALEKAAAADVVKALPQGLDSFVGTFSQNLSGGELRRLCLARALMVEREFLILDEPLEGLDAALACKVIENAVKGRGGVIIISHKALNFELSNLNVLKL